MTTARLIRSSIATAALCMCVSSCSMFSSTVVDAKSIQYSYKIDRKDLPNLVQVYELGGKTVVQFVNAGSLNIVVTDPGDRTIPFQTIGENIVLGEALTAFRITTSKGTATVVSNSLPANSDPFSIIRNSNVVEVSSSEQQLRDEIVKIKEEINSLRTQLEIERKKVATTGDETKVTVTFKDNSTDFNPTLAQEKSLLRLVDNATEIYIKGFTDSAVSNKASATLAKKRAEQAEQFLIKKGINPKQIRQDFSPSGDFLVDNRSTDGKAKNRRVEITII